MQDWILSIIDSFGYIGIAALIAIENIFPPIPSEVILTFGGFVTSYTDLTVVGVIIASTIGAVIGAVGLYLMGRLLDTKRLEGWIEKWGKPLRLKQSDITNAAGWFEKHGSKTVFFCRFIPIIRSLISIPAGMSHMKVSSFLILTTIGTAIWNTVLVILGSVVGDRWESIAAIFDEFSNITLIVFIVIAVVIIAAYVWFRFYKDKNNDEAS